jgi:hypothetical protein
MVTEDIVMDMEPQHPASEPQTTNRSHRPEQPQTAVHGTFLVGAAAVVAAALDTTECTLHKRLQKLGIRDGVTKGKAKANKAEAKSKVEVDASNFEYYILDESKSLLDHCYTASTPRQPR